VSNVTNVPCLKYPTSPRCSRHIKQRRSLEVAFNFPQIVEHRTVRDCLMKAVLVSFSAHAFANTGRRAKFCQRDSSTGGPKCRLSVMILSYLFDGRCHRLRLPFRAQPVTGRQMRPSGSDSSLRCAAAYLRPSACPSLIQGDGPHRRSDAVRRRISCPRA
jgi:hypothetical protein